MEIHSTKYNSRAQTATTIIKNSERILDSSAVQFIEGTPIECNYYCIDTDASTTGRGFRDVDTRLGGAIKYNFIRNYVLYGFNEVKEMSKEEKEETGIQMVPAPNQALNLPNTLQPKEGDLLTLHIENNSIIYRVTSVEATSFHNRPYIKIEWTTEENLPFVEYSHKDMVKDGLITNEYDFISDNIGTDYTCFLKSGLHQKVLDITKLRDELNDTYIDYFYDENRNILININDDSLETRDYFPILVDYQMEFKPLYVYGINMILHHETILNKRSKINFKMSKLRKFIQRKDDDILDVGLAFKKWVYVTNNMSPTYKLQSYLNDNRFYNIFDYGQGENVEVPEMYLDIFKKFYNHSLNSNYLLDVLPDVVEIDITKEYLLYTPVLISILDIFLQETLLQEKSNRFY